jgi:hypothetical protein
MKLIFKTLFCSIIYCLFSLECSSQINPPAFVNPNPCDTGTTLTFLLLGNDTVTCYASNITGQIVFNAYQNAMLPSNLYQIYFDTKNWSVGIYFIFLKINSNKQGIKVIVDHGTVNEVKETFSDYLIVAPNPVKNLMFFSTIEKLNISIINLNGQLIRQYK